MKRIRVESEDDDSNSEFAVSDSSSHDSSASLEYDSNENHTGVQGPNSNRDTHSDSNSDSNATRNTKAVRKLKQATSQHTKRKVTVTATSPPNSDLELDNETLKLDHSLRPIYAAADGSLYLEAFSPIAEQAIDFLVAEPVSRPKLIHEYILTEYSLYAAVSVGIQTESIIQVLNKLCKTDLPDKLVSFIRKHTNSYGKVKLVLKDNHQYVESAFPEVLRILLKNEVIKDARISVAENSTEVSNDFTENAQNDEFTTRFQTFEPVTFTRPAFVPKTAGSASNTMPRNIRENSNAVAKSNSSVAYQNSASSTQGSQVSKLYHDFERDYIDLFETENDDLFDEMSVLDPFENLDPTQIEKLDRILSGKQPAIEFNSHILGENSDENSQPFVNRNVDETRGQTNRVQSDPIDLAPPITLAQLDKETDEENSQSLIMPQDILDLNIAFITDPTAARTLGSQAAPASVIISSFEIARMKSEHVRKACSAAGFPILEEYDFRADTTIPTFDIALKPAAILRPYQEKSLNKMFGNGRARSGIIVLPCGAGKTLVGVTAACTIKKRVLVLCTSAVSVEQWAREFKSWANVKDGDVAKFTSQHKELVRLPNDNGILISTYTMVTFSNKRAYDAQKMMDYICSREWGLLLLDEVHVVPADMFRKVLTIVAAHCKLGLTATLVREDDKIGNLNYLIGPKLYEANWLDLAKKGHIANVRCSEVWCTMTKEFYKEYLGQSSRKRQLLYVMNPNKIQACQYLIDYHEARGDKHYATKLNRPYIYGGSSTADRLRTLQQFKYNPSLNTIFLSKVGDTSIDIPEASCLIQISSHYGSRRQEAQRLGRILRAKKNAIKNGDYNSFFYTLVSRDTEEVYYCAKRQQFLIDQGYAYDIITQLDGMETVAPLVYRSINERLELLATILVSHDMVVFDDEELEDYDSLGSSAFKTAEFSSSEVNKVTQVAATMSSLSGADNMAYIEQTRGGVRHRRFDGSFKKK
ncbi:hypothetical protein HK100_008278 [Physocladia obscura]|uniref:DNA 3'-5' helicase n=1 Tax=Physocladia obscura TaxID=109957 RepID=A0AAD5TA65_9FUNG|nr:hypothetical protein HK100_008278 [Physocladia obscura]